jgi:hypothetical protein
MKPVLDLTTCAHHRIPIWYPIYHYLYSVLIAAFKEFRCAYPQMSDRYPVTGFLCTNARLDRKGQKILFAIAPHSGILCANHCCRSGCFLTGSTSNFWKRLDPTFESIWIRFQTFGSRSDQKETFSLEIWLCINVLAHRIPICSAQDSKLESGVAHR